MFCPPCPSPLLIRDVLLRLNSYSLILTVRNTKRPAFSGEVSLTRDLDAEVFDSAPRRVLQDALAELKGLANIIQSSVEQIEAVVIANSFTFPSPESPFSFESEAPRMHPAIQSAGLLITSAAAQLMTLVRPAPITVLDVEMQVRSKVSQAQAIVYCSRCGNDEVPCLQRNACCDQYACC